jgi:hypothetical protein
MKGAAALKYEKEGNNRRNNTVKPWIHTGPPPGKHMGESRKALQSASPASVTWLWVSSL